MKSTRSQVKSKGKSGGHMATTAATNRIRSQSKSAENVVQIHSTAVGTVKQTQSQTKSNGKSGGHLATTAGASNGIRSQSKPAENVGTLKQIQPQAKQNNLKTASNRTRSQRKSTENVVQMCSSAAVTKSGPDLKQILMILLIICMPLQERLN